LEFEVENHGLNLLHHMYSYEEETPGEKEIEE